MSSHTSRKRLRPSGHCTGLIRQKIHRCGVPIPVDRIRQCTSWLLPLAWCGLALSGLAVSCCARAQEAAKACPDPLAGSWQVSADIEEYHALRTYTSLPDGGLLEADWGSVDVQTESSAMVGSWARGPNNSRWQWSMGLRDGGQLEWLEFECVGGEWQELRWRHFGRPVRLVRWLPLNGNKATQTPINFRER